MVKKNNGLILKNNVEIYNTFSILQSFGFNMDIKCLYSRIMYYKDCGVSISLRNINLILSDSNCFRNCTNKSDTELSKRYPLPI